MKRKLFYLFTALMVGALVWSCGTDDEDPFDQSLLPGYWVSDTEYWFYRANGTGYTWDTSDDVNESEAQSFTWTLTGDDFTQIHIVLGVEQTPKYYTMLKLTSTALEYEDTVTSKKHSFSKTTQP